MDDLKRMGATKASSSSSSSSIGEESTSSLGSSCSSSDLVDDASSSLTLSQDSPPSSSFACRDGGGPLWELSDLMTHLPIKRGLSRHYAGKSQSFTSLASARSIEDLAKKEENPCAKRLKLCTGRRGVGFDGRSSPDIRGTTLESMPRKKRPSFMATSRPPPIPAVVRTF